MDYEIEVWTMFVDVDFPTTHFAECSCGKFSIDSENKTLIENAVWVHRTNHQERGDSVEIV